MLRIHFTEKDLARIALSPGAEPMWEVLLSTYRLRRPEGGRVFGQWRAETRSLLSSRGQALMDLIPPRGYCPDFLTPAVPTTDIREGAAALAETPIGHLRTDLGEFAQDGNRVPRWLMRMADGESNALGDLSRATQDYFRRCIAAHWPVITRTVARDRARRVDALHTGGPDLLLSTLHTQARWRAPVLEVAFPVEQDLYLNGRGLRLIPSFFCQGMPTTYKNTDLSPVLVYSIDHRRPLSIEDKQTKAIGTAALSALLGETRARVLCAVASERCNTSELARRTRTSPATASQHASVLRNAGLIWSYKSGKSVIHVATPLGLALLGSGPRHARPPTTT